MSSFWGLFETPAGTRLPNPYFDALLQHWIFLFLLLVFFFFYSMCKLERQSQVNICSGPAWISTCFYVVYIKCIRIIRRTRWHSQLFWWPPGTSPLTPGFEFQLETTQIYCPPETQIHHSDGYCSNPHFDSTLLKYCTIQEIISTSYTKPVRRTCQGCCDTPVTGATSQDCIEWSQRVQEWSTVAGNVKMPTQE